MMLQLARSQISVAFNRSFQKSSFHPPSSRFIRALSTKKVPTVTYVDNQKSAAAIQIDPNKEKLSTFKHDDISRNAEPFDRASLKRMTPTMRNFTLDGKVALVTGYVTDVSLNSCGAYSNQSILSLTCPKACLAMNIDAWSAKP